MRLPWARVEGRESSYTDTLVDLIVTRASGDTAKATATGALEAASGIVARAFAAAEVSGPPELTGALTPSLLSMVGRALIRQGEFVAAINVKDGRVTLTPAADWDVTGGHDPDGWNYRLNLAGPSRSTTRPRTPASAVIHLTYSRDPARPWRGVGPIESASLAGRLSAETLAALADESSGARGQLLPVPTDGQDPTVEQLRADIRKLKGQTALVETTQAGWGEGRSGAPQRDWQPNRIGANPPAPLVQLHDTASREVLAAVGVNPALFSAGDGTAAREAWRQLLFGVVAPLGRIVQEELQAKLETEITISWEELRASDLSGRARAFQSMVGGGMDVAKAASLAGLMDAE